MIASMKKKHAEEKPRTNDRRVTPFFVVRLRAAYRKGVEALAKENRRTMTTEVEVALEEYLAKRGLWPPAEGDDQ